MALNRFKIPLTCLFALGVASCASTPDSGQPTEAKIFPETCQDIINETRALKESGDIKSLTSFAVGDIETPEDAKNWLQGVINSGWGADEQQWGAIRDLNKRLWIHKTGGMLSGNKNEYSCGR